MPGRLTERVLLVGCDGADLGLIQLMLEEGRVPHFARLVDNGVMGYVRSREPHFPATLWSTLATGRRADAHRVLGYLQPSAEGDRLIPVDGRLRRCPTVWEIAAVCGLRTHVIAWPATPCSPPSGVFVAEHVVRAWRGEVSHAQLASGVTPESARKPILDLLIAAGDLTASELLPFVPLAADIDQRQDPRLAFLAGVLADGVNTHCAATWALAHEPWDLAVVHYDLVDRLSHAFMAYHPPGLETFDERIRRIYQHVVQQGYVFFDQFLGRLVELAGESATVIVVSPHGFAHAADRPRDRGPLRSHFQWHRQFGILLAKGPPIKADEWTWGADVLDVAPTILALLGLPLGDELDGRPLVRILREPCEPARLPSWANRVSPQHVDPPTLADERIALRHLFEDGFVEVADVTALDALERYRDGHDFALAQVFADSARSGDAHPILESLVVRRPDVDSYLMLQARVKQDLGDLAGSRQLIERLMANGLPRLQSALVQCALLSGEGRPREALEVLLDVEATHPEHAGLHCHIGDVYLALERWPDATRAFTRALRLEPASSRAWLGMAVADLADGRFESAADHAREAIRLTYHLPMAHYHLGVALARLEVHAEAARAFEACLEQRPNTPEAHAWLARLYWESLGDPEMAREHQALAGGPRSKH